MAFKGYHDLCVRVAGKLYDIHLSWRKDVAPQVSVRNLVEPNSGRKETR
jgi:hypothetical protein